MPDPSVKIEAILEPLFTKVPYIYINSSQAIGSNWDVRIVFSERIIDKLEPRVGIVMSHQHAKAFLEAFSHTMDRVETMMGGPIRFKPMENPPEISAEAGDDPNAG